MQIATGENGPVYAQNIYEYHEGHVHLISDGHDVSTDQTGPACPAVGSSVCLLGTDATGANVFFATADQLLPQDSDTQIDWYDARICTASSPCIRQPPPSLPPCLGETCHGTPAATPLVPNVPSVTFNGQGNVASPSYAKTVTKKATKCPKGKRRSHSRCVKAKPNKAKKAARKVKSHRGGK